jgi:pantothenate kinase
MAVALCEALGPTVARVPMDGFHLANQVLRGLGIADRKGSPASFDVGGFHALLKRLRSNDEQIVYAPEFYREFEESIAGALPIPSKIELVIVEGNYLLLEEGQWQHTAALLDEVWYLSPQETVRQTRLVRRHQANGRTLEAARAWIAGNDDPNAQVVATTANRANAIIVADPR